nr:MAG TPA_asm: hypothetical protein [Caudoviricetes sp.]DAV85800.1 MAG TPA: hypothetical protein [Caudoviricetes sp.]DAZ71434.1 MAG TPA: hypothetical protein [Caudoviricetes sp.]
MKGGSKVITCRAQRSYCTTNYLVLITWLGGASGYK